MRKLYARFVLWLIQPALDLTLEDETVIQSVKLASAVVGASSGTSPMEQRAMINTALCRLVAGGCTDPESIQAAADGLAAALAMEEPISAA